ncbi:cell division protein FtsW [Planosporangium thailandense]|uniref:Probable peptidoglycan glycosyltransferase FtsW n=1 Tax=Planosporangium thailandense TaxID=765197 RepID=A0ABX0XUV1_9ACTN|nr:putative peptidoglycan glycosyltransferase FtsW [Planosporangium thailandense]NJC69795.1 cell division protein FtsW [Planosporangium thailandense]
MAALRGLLDRPLASYYLLLASLGLLLVFGLVMVFSATSVENFRETHSPYTSLIKQSTWAVVGLLGFWFCQRLPMRTYRGIARYVLIVSMVLMVVLDMLTFLGGLSGGPNPTPLRLGPLHADENWLYIGPIQGQPSELGKLGLILWSADILTRKGTKIANWRELITPVFPVALLLLGLVGYSDFGTMTCLFLAFLGVLWAAGVQKRVFAVLFGAAVVGMTVLIQAAPYRMARVTVFLDPAHADRNGPAYQFFQGLYAIADGGWFGVGLGRGPSKWGLLPNGHNDSIFAVIAEELGVVGCLVLLVLLAVLACTGLRIARRVEHPFRRLVATGITCWLVGQAAINIGGVIGIMPMTGVPLPFISDGGTALVVALGAAGILTSFARAEPDAARALHARPPRRWVQLVWAPLPPLPQRGAGRRASAREGTGASARPGAAASARTGRARAAGARADNGGRAAGGVRQR